MSRTPSRRIPVLLAAALLVVGGCSDDGGPGEIRIELSSLTPIGGVVLELSGKGIEGVTPPLDGWAEFQLLQSSSNPGARIVAFPRTPGDMALTVQVANVDEPIPLVRLLAASDGDNREIEFLGAITIKVVR